jgi:hypothetical protein
VAFSLKTSSKEISNRKQFQKYHTIFPGFSYLIHTETSIPEKITVGAERNKMRHPTFEAISAPEETEMTRD